MEPRVLVSTGGHLREGPSRGEAGKVPYWVEICPVRSPKAVIPHLRLRWPHAVEAIGAVAQVWLPKQEAMRAKTRELVAQIMEAVNKAK